MSETTTPTEVKPVAEMTLDEARTRLAKARGPQYWRSLEELAASGSFQRMLEREMPRQAVADWDPIDRRDFVRLMGASLALAGLTACTKQPEEKIIPYVTQPEELIPGKPLFYATAMTLGGAAYGLLAESHMGRPTKLEGNPEHPATLGSTDVFLQAAILGMYDPDRSQSLLNRGRAGSWDVFARDLGDTLAVQIASGGAGLRILTETNASPTLQGQLDALLKTYPKAKWIQYEPINNDNARAGAKLAFGEVVDPVYRLDRAKVILSLDADFLTFGPGHIRYARDFAAARNVSAGPGEMNRLYIVESTVSNTGAASDHRLPVKPSHVVAIARAIAAAVGVQGASGDAHGHEAWIKAVAHDLTAHAGHAVVIAGAHQSPEVHALANAMNVALNAVDSTVSYLEPVDAAASQVDGLKELVADMNAGKVQVLAVLGGNPVANAPADLAFGEAMKKVAFRLHLGLYEDETSALCQWHLPETHFLEAWSDGRAFDGTAAIVQPLIQPLYMGRSIHEVVNMMLGKASVSGFDTVREHWKGRNLAADFEVFWRRCVHDGHIPGTARNAKKVAVTGAIPATEPAYGDFELTLLPDVSLYDGRFANNGWLQEVPRPLTKIVWDNALLVAPATAEKRGWSSGQLVELTAGGTSVKAPVWVTPGHPEDCGTLHLGYGRKLAGRTGADVGVDAYPLLSTTSGFAFPVDVAAKGGKHQLVVTQEHQIMEGRWHMRAGSLGVYKAQPDFVNNYEEFGGKDPKTIYKPDVDFTKGDQWGMVINLTACIGCNACVVACQSENNIPVVGKDQVRRNREMHWIRIDRYYQGDSANPKTHMQPVTCMQCEYAPCESVCPVAATVHSNDGINQMVYNRCVGTRYCSNNCPYKVRRFNFYKYADHETPSLKLMRNPDVTVRSRGVMEKCTFCTQRIAQARITAKKQDRPIRDGEIMTACQQACPTRAISFGSITDASSEVTKLRGSPLHYGLLRELNTRPRVTYLARVQNVNAELEPDAAPAGHGHGQESGHGAHGES